MGVKRSRSKVRLVTVAFTSLLVAASLAGCASSSDKDTTPAGPTARPPAPPAEADEDTGGLEGVVMTDEAQPFEGATVGIGVLQLTTISDSAGRFSLSHVTPGTYVLQATYPGYLAAPKTVAVRAGEVTRGVELIIVKLAAQEPYKDVQDQNGVFGCGASWTPPIPPEPLPGYPGPLLPERFSGLAACGFLEAANFITDTSPYDQFLLEWVLEGPLEAWNASVFEMTWNSNQLAGRGLSMIWEIDGCVNADDRKGRIASASGRSPIRVEVSRAKIEEVMADTCAQALCGDRQCHLVSRVFATPETTGDEAADVGANLQQAFTQFHSAFFYEGPEPDYSALNA